MDEDKIRLEALKLAIKSCGDRPNVYSPEQIEVKANKFYNYITTGRMNEYGV